MSKEEAVKAALELLNQAGIHARIVRIYGSTTEAIIVLPEVKFTAHNGGKARQPVPALSVVMDQ